MSKEESKSRGIAYPQHYYGTFQGVHPNPAIDFPQPAPPPGALVSPPPYYHLGYQPVQGYVAVAEGIPIIRELRLPCCGIGLGWFLFAIGFFLAIPWYAGALIVLCSRVDRREKPGFIACTIAAVLATIALLFGITEKAHGY